MCLHGSLSNSVVVVRPIWSDQHKKLRAQTPLNSCVFTYRWYTSNVLYAPASNQPYGKFLLALCSWKSCNHCPGNCCNVHHSFCTHHAVLNLRTVQRVATCGCCRLLMTCPDGVSSVSCAPCQKRLWLKLLRIAIWTILSWWFSSGRGRDLGSSRPRDHRTSAAPVHLRLCCPCVLIWTCTGVFSWSVLFSSSLPSRPLLGVAEHAGVEVSFMKNTFSFFVLSLCFNLSSGPCHLRSTFVNSLKEQLQKKWRTSTPCFFIPLTGKTDQWLFHSSTQRHSHHSPMLCLPCLPLPFLHLRFASERELSCTHSHLPSGFHRQLFVCLLHIKWPKPWHPITKTQTLDKHCNE